MAGLRIKSAYVLCARVAKTNFFRNRLLSLYKRLVDTQIMKRTFYFAVSVLLVAGLTSCSQIRDLLTINVETEFNVTLPVSVDELSTKSTQSYPFSAETTFDPLTADELLDYTARISQIELTDIVATIQEVSEDFTLLNATLLISGEDADGNALQVEWTFTNVTITEGFVLTLTHAAGEFTTLSSILTGMGEVAVSFSGNSSVPGVTYEVLTQMFADVTVGL